MIRIYHHGDTMYVAAEKVYTKTDGLAYTDEKCTTKATTEEVYDAFCRGLIIVNGGVEYLPISCKIADDVATVTYVTADTTTATTAKLATVKTEAKSKV